MIRQYRHIIHIGWKLCCQASSNYIANVSKRFTCNYLLIVTNKEVIFLGNTELSRFVSLMKIISSSTFCQFLSSKLDGVVIYLSVFLINETKNPINLPTSNVFFVSVALMHVQELSLSICSNFVIE